MLFNGVFVYKSLVAKNNYNPEYNEHVQIRVPPAWTIYQCALEVQVWAEGGISGPGPFLGGCIITGKELEELLVPRMSEGSFVTTEFALEKTHYLSDDDQGLVKGRITLRGDVISPVVKDGHTRRGASQ